MTNQTRGRSAGLFMAACAILLVALSFFAAPVAHPEEEFLDPELAFVFSAASSSTQAIDVHFKIAPRYYMYRERFEFSVSPASSAGVIGTPEFPNGIVKYDPTFEKDLEVYYDQVTIRLPLSVDAGPPQALTLAISSQGCADAGLCYPPMVREISLVPVAGGYQASGDGVLDRVPGAQTQTSSRDMGDIGFADYLSNAGWLQVILLCVVLGMLLSFTPCVLPMVPILLAILAGNTANLQKVSRWRGLTLAAAFVLGMSLVYTALGVAAGLIGASLSVWLQTPWVLGFFAILLALFALAMFDVFTLQAPGAMQTALNRCLSRIPGGRYTGAFLMGMISALIVGPCVAAPLAGVLLFISQTGDLVLGGTALFALAWGQGVLLLAVGASSGVLLPKAGPWMNGIKHLFGVMLFATAWWMVNSLVPDWLAIAGWALLALWSAAMLGAFEPIPAGAAGRYLGKAVGLLLALWAVILLVGLAGGGRELLRPLAPFTNSSTASDQVYGAAPAQFTAVRSVAELDNILANTSKPVMLDFYADWCVSCIEMEKFTFSDPDVAKQMSEFLLVQADVTKNTDDDRALLKRFKLFGPPGIIFFDAQGRQLDDARVIGFKNAKEFGAVLSKVLSRPAPDSAASFRPAL